MKPRFLFLTMGLVAALTVASCSAPAAPPTEASPQEAAPVPAAAPTNTSAPETTVIPADTVAPTQAAEVQPIPTSRGPKLEATDPATVSLASGQLQLVEFFRFT